MTDQVIDQIIHSDLRRYLEDEGHAFVGENTLCPLHADKNPSLHVSQKEGSWLWYCHACKKGGSIINYLMETRGLTKGEAIRQLTEHFHLDGGNGNGHGRPAPSATYTYTDEEKRPLYSVLRFEPKAFKADRKMAGVRQVLYHLPEVLAGDPVWLVEGEKDADNVRRLGLTATTTPFGVSHWRPHFAEPFKGKAVRICLDTGYEFESVRRAKDIALHAREVKIIQLPGLEKDQDISDWIELHDAQDTEGLRAALEDIAASAPVFDAKEPEPEPVPSENLPESAPTGADFPVIHNAFLNRYIESIARSTDASPIFLLFSGIALLSGVLNKFYFMFPRRTNLNLYILLLAPSTYYRKSTTTDVVADYLNEVNSSLLLPDSFTPEALYKILNKYPRGLIIWRELIQVKEFQLGSEYNRGLASFLVDIYDYKKAFKRWTVGDGGEIVVENPIVSILSAGIATWFVESLKKKDFEGGIWTRFIFVPAPEQDRDYRLPSPLYLDRGIETRLRELDALEPDQEIDVRPILPLMEEWGREHMRQVMRTEGDLQAVFQRLEVMLIKLACLFQLAEDGSLKVGEQSFRDAVTVIEWIKAKLPRFFQEEVRFDWFSKQMATIEKIIRKRGQILRSDILSATRIKAKLADEILKQLIDEGRIEEIEIPPTSKGGRTGTAFRIKP
ncbi:MAG: CHC2 zinc finger domain-containing protein [Acidobacteriota bacterium]